MFSAPWLAPLLAAFVGGALAGFSITLALLSMRRRIVSRELEKRTLYVRWLAGRVVLSRATLSLVAAMRALKTNGEAATLRDLRIAEAQRSRSAWFLARRQLDRASVALQAWYTSQGDERSIIMEDRSAVMMRQATDGADAELAQLVQTLRELDAAAKETMRQALSPRPSALWSTMCRSMALTAAPFRKVLQQWSAQP